MEIVKAIEILNDIIVFEHSAGATDKGDAIKLGIQALNRLNFMRSYNIAQAKMPLPAERKVWTDEEKAISNIRLATNEP